MSEEQKQEQESVPLPEQEQKPEQTPEPELDFAKLRFKFWGKCKVCKIVYADNDLFTQIHRLRFTDGLTLSSIVAYLKEKFIEKNFSILLPNEINLHNHFHKHIPIDLVVAHRKATKKNAVVKVSKSEVPENTRQSLCEIVDKRVAVHDEFEALYKKTKLQVEEFEREFDGKIAIANAPNHVLLIKELKSFLVELSKMNSNEQLVKVILQTAFQKYTICALQSMVKENDLLKITLKSCVKDSDEVDRIISGHQQRLYDGLSFSSKEAINLIKDQFKIN
jgi:hypothetical protein